MLVYPSQTGRAAVRTRRLHPPCFAAIVAILAIVGVPRKAELSIGAGSMVHRAVMSRLISGSGPGSRSPAADSSPLNRLDGGCSIK